MIPLLASLTWDPGIRGILVVAFAVGVLCGTPLILLITNVGSRIGLYLAATAIFGWLTLMFFFWAIYGLGYKGPEPSWKVKDVSNVPAMARSNALHDAPQPARLGDPESFIEGNAKVEEAIGSKSNANLSDVVAADPEIATKLKGKLNGWRIVPSSDPVAADSAASAGEFLQTNGYNGAKFQTSSSYVIGTVLERGGKPKRKDASMMSRVTHRVQTTAMFFVADNPTHYAVVQIRATIPQIALPGEPPPAPVVDPNQPVINVLLVRDLGAVRQPGFAFGTLSLIVFLILCYELHRRDKAGMAARAAAELHTTEV